jgi:flagellar assembly factor FliW
MTELITKKFGKLEYREESVFVFPRGLPAFEHEKEFVPIEDPALARLIFLQSTHTRELCFLALPVETVDREYRLEVAPEDLAALGMDTHRQPLLGSEVVALALLCVSDNAAVTANLLAPVVVNLANRRAVQAVRSDARYSPRHTLSGEAPPAPRGTAAC